MYQESCYELICTYQALSSRLDMKAINCMTVARHIFPLHTTFMGLYYMSLHIYHYIYLVYCKVCLLYYTYQSSLMLSNFSISQFLDLMIRLEHNEE